MLESEPRTRTYLAFIPLRELYAQTGGYQTTLKWPESHRLRYICPHIHTCRRWCLIGRKSVRGIVDDFYIDMFHR